MQFDIRTLFLILGLFNFFLVVILLLFWKTQKIYPGFPHWVFAQIFLSFGYALFIVRGHIPDVLSIVIANVLFVFATILLAEGVYRFCCNKKVSRFFYAFPVIVGVVYSYFRYVENNLPARNTATAIVFMIIGLAVSRVIFLCAPKRHRTVYYFSGLLFVVHVCIICFRAIVILISPDFVFLSSNSVNTLYFLFAMFFYGGINFAFIMWNHTRMMDDLSLSNEDLNEALDEKESLLRELNHRTKNNLQIITSMIRLKRSAVKNTETRDVLNDIETRVQTLSLVYQKLSHTKSITSIPMDEYIKELSSLILSAFHGEKKIQLNVNCIPVKFTIDNAASIGIVLNEIITNSLKHAFHGRDDGMISIVMTAEKGEICLIVSDNGSGFKMDLDNNVSTSFGVQIVQSVIRNQCDGKIDLQINNGTRWIMRLDDSIVVA